MPARSRSGGSSTKANGRGELMGNLKSSSGRLRRGHAQRDLLSAVRATTRSTVDRRGASALLAVAVTCLGGTCLPGGPGAGGLPWNATQPPYYTIQPVAPSELSPPRVTGEAKVGQSLHATAG